MYESGRLHSADPDMLTVFGPSEGKYHFWGSDRKTIPTPFSRSMDGAITQLQQALAVLADTSTDWFDREDDEINTALEGLKTAGSNLFEALAPDPLVRDLLSMKLSTVSYLSALSHKNVPWEFIYLGDRNLPVNVFSFLGATRVVGRSLESFPIRTQSGLISPIVDKFKSVSPDKVITIRVAQDKRLKSAQLMTEVEILKRGDYDVNILPDLHGPSSLETLTSFLSMSSFLTHFNCHADEEVPGISVNTIYVSNEFAVDRDLIKTMPIPQGSLIVLNCCHGQSFRHDVEDTLATSFASQRVAAVISATGRVDDTYATLWAEHFYTALFDGRTVGDSLLYARRAIITQTNNPCCLMYSLLGEFSAYLPRHSKLEAA
jgi:hypothetical protein